MQRYRFQDRVICSPSHPQWAALLAEAHAEHVRPKCLCQSDRDGPSMYIASLRGAHLVKRMPFTGGTHAPHCEHYEAPAELSGLGQVSGSAIKEDPDEDVTTLALGFALTKGASRAPKSGVAVEHESVRGDGTKLTLRATLHYLYDQAGLTRWSPRMSGKRSWFVVQRELLSAAFNKVTKGMMLNDVLFIPESFAVDRADDIAARRATKLARLAEKSSGRMLIMAPVKEIGPARFGFRMMLYHLPDMPLQLNEDLYRRLTDRFSLQLGLWNNLPNTELLVVGTFSQSQPGVYVLEEACLVNVNRGWIPFETAEEFRLLDELASRRFTKGQRYNLASTKPLASAILNDTLEPTALYIIGADASDEYVAAADELAKGSDLASWWWRGEATVPPLPPTAEEAESAARAHRELVPLRDEDHAFDLADPDEEYAP